MKKRLQRTAILTLLVFAAIIVNMGLTPNVACGCPQYEEGTKLTEAINRASQFLIGKPLIAVERRLIN